MDIEWQEGAACFADGKYLYAPKSTSSVELLDVNLYKINMGDAINASDFQLNTIKQGDYIEASELDNQKYNDAVDVFGLFGFRECTSYSGLFKFLLIDCNDEVCTCSINYPEAKRKITYNQLMAIGELKRLEIECDNRDAEDMFVNDKSHVELSVDGGEMSLNINSSELVNKQEVKIQKNKPVVAQVMIDLTERMEIGIKTYGEALRVNNGRDALQDAYEEALDLACYLKQAMIERDNADTN